MATVPTGLQTCAKVLQMHFSGGGGTPVLQPTSNSTLTLVLPYLLQFLAADYLYKYFYYSGHCANRVANLCKSAANTFSRGCGPTLVAIQKLPKL